MMRRRKAKSCVRTKLVMIETGEDNDEVKAKRWKNNKMKLTLNLRAIASEFVTKNVGTISKATRAMTRSSAATVGTFSITMATRPKTA